MLCKNTGNSDAEFQIDGHPGQPPKKYKVAPGDTVDVPDGYCRPYKSDTQRTLPPIITQLHPHMKPLGERAKGQLPTATAIGETGGQAEVMAMLGKLSAKIDNLENENRKLRAENARVRNELPDRGAAADEKAIDADTDDKPAKKKAS